MKYPIFLIDNHYIMKLYYILFLLSEFGENKKGTLVINENKLKYLYFFLENKDVLKKDGRELRSLDTLEKFLEFDEVSSIIKLGISQDLIEIQLKSFDIYYKISDLGKQKIKNIKNILDEQELKLIKNILKLNDKKLSELFI